MADLRGSVLPRTATGQASILPAPPWHYSGELLTIEYRTHPDRVIELQPDAGGYDRRLAEARLTIPGTTETGGFVNSHVMYHPFPAGDRGRGRAASLHELSP